MSNQYRLVELENSELLAGLAELVQQSNVLTAQLLAHLVELEERMLHLELGFSSLFAYCVEALRMSEGSAGRRVTAARVCRQFPGAFERVARGEFHLCALCALAPHLDPENEAELLDACGGKTRRQVEELLAMRFPRPDVREQIRRLPVRAQPPAAPTQPNALSSRAIDHSTSPAIAQETPPIQPNPTPLPAGVTGARGRARELEPLSTARFGVHFTADAELRALIERARALASHRLPKGDLAGLVKLMAANFVRQEEKRRFGIGARSRQVSSKPKLVSAAEEPTPPGGAPASPGPNEPTQRRGRRTYGDKPGRYLPVSVRREIYSRDRGRCSFVAGDGRRCTAGAFVEFDHVEPFAKRGASDTRNIRLLCRAHNRLHARNCFGKQHIAAKMAARKHVRNRGTSGS